MIFLLAINLVSIFGFYFFLLHPENLSHFPSMLPFFSISMPLFSQLQIAAGFLVLAFGCRKVFSWTWLPWLICAFLISFTMEFCGTTWGIPFGKYSYTTLLGWKIAGQVPLLIPISWFTMALPSWMLAKQILGSRNSLPIRMLTASVLLLTWDLTLDPAMSQLTPYWIWEQEGVFFMSMPVKNLMGWMLTGLLIMGSFEFFKITLPEDWKENHFPLKFYLTNLTLPLGIAIAGGLWMPVLATAIVASFGFWIRSSK